jgi:hypothetical protein
VYESTKIGELVGILNTTDANEHSGYIYSLEKGNGENDSDNDCFVVEGSQLKAKCEFNYQLKTSYKIYLKSNDGYGGEIYKTFEIKVEKPTKIKTGSDKERFNVYPNPSKGIICIDNNEERNIEVQICDLNGKQFVHIENYSNEKIDIHNLPKGLYLLKLYTADEVYMRKILLE